MLITIYYTLPGRSQDLAGGAKCFFIYTFACRSMRFARGLGACSTENIIKNGVIWYVLVIGVCLKKFPFFLRKK